MSRLILAIESSTDWLSVALLRDEARLCMRESEPGRRHAATLLPTIDAVLREAEVGLDDVDAIAIATGPGSFTSLRIGLATVKGLGFGRAMEGIGVSTLEAMALAGLEEGAAGDAREVVALLDARRGEWYAGGWSGAREVRGLPQPTLPEGLYDPTGLARELTRHARERARLTGEHVGGARLVCPEPGDWKAAFEAAGLGVDDAIVGAAARPRADVVGRLGSRRLERGEGVAIERLEARYLRRAEAEARRLGAPVEAGERVRVGEPGGEGASGVGGAGPDAGA